jgi:hypothetical protein
MTSEWDFLEHALFSEGAGAPTDVSSLEKSLLNEIKNRMCPIRYTDIVIGNFIVNLDDNNMILYKVIETNGASFKVATSNSTATVFYATDNKSMLLCKSATLGKDFHYKISALDIRRIIETFRTNWQQEEPTVVRQKSIRTVSFQNNYPEPPGQIRTDSQKTAEKYLYRMEAYHNGYITDAPTVATAPATAPVTVFRQPEPTTATAKAKTNWFLKLATCGFLY